MDDLFLKGQTVLIVGAGRHPGPLLAQALARRGATVAANDLSPILLDPLIEAIQESPGQVKTYIADATRGMPLRSMLEEVQEDCGAIDILINNPRIQPDTALMDIDEWDWQRTIEMNLNGPFLVSRLVAQSMLEKQHGIIINIVDTTSMLLKPGRAAYAASQSGLLAFSQAAERELITYNIRVYTLCPDLEVLNQAESFCKKAPNDAETGQEESLAKLAVMLCSPEANILTDRTFYISQSGYHPQPGFAA